MFIIGDRVKSSAVFHNKHWDVPLLKGTIVDIDEAELVSSSGTPYLVRIDSWDMNASFMQDELDLL